MATEVRIISHLCNCDKCTSRTKRTYLLSASCSNCGEHHVAKYRVGDSPGILDECPFCGVSRVHYGTTEEAVRMLSPLIAAKVQQK